MSNFTQIDEGYPVAGQKHYAQRLQLLQDGKRFRIWNDHNQVWVSDWLIQGQEAAQAEFDARIHGRKYDEILDDEDGE